MPWGCTGNMKSHFFALLARMKFIRRWGLMHNTVEENIQEHTLQTAMIAYHLAVLRNTCFGGKADASMAAVLAMYHDVSEIYTGDMPTPVKYFSPQMRHTYREVEQLAQQRIWQSLPEEIRPAYQTILLQAEDHPEWPLVKAADTISAYLKCLQEKNAGNHEFDEAYRTLREKLLASSLPEVALFLRDYEPSFLLTIDEINR